ncbi:MAG: hypothetical protein M3R17_09890 [Bacteroidota bacterium]|nr:hypothetical protein [Bacteroidota bacterium]
MDYCTDNTRENAGHSHAHSLSAEQTNSRSERQFVDNRQETISQLKLRQIADSSPRIAQLNAFRDMANPPVASFSGLETANAVLQRVVAPSYANKKKRVDKKTEIPWKRPKWLRGEEDGMQTVLEDLINAGKVARSKENKSYLLDGLTGTWVPMTGVNIDHIVDWSQFAKNQGVVDDLQELEEAYHEMDNLHITAARTNSSNSKTDILEWMVSPSHKKYMDQMENSGGQERIMSFLSEEVVNSNPFFELSDISESKRGKFIEHLGVIQNPREGMNMDQPMDGLKLLMAYSNARSMSGVDMSTIYGQSNTNLDLMEEEDSN